jgi:hypothetical protein
LDETNAQLRGEVHYVVDYVVDYACTCNKLYKRFVHFGRHVRLCGQKVGEPSRTRRFNCMVCTRVYRNFNNGVWHLACSHVQTWIRDEIMFYYLVQELVVKGMKYHVGENVMLVDRTGQGTREEILS